MNHVILAIVFVVAFATATHAQTEGRIGVGVSTTINHTTDGDVGIGKGVGVLIRLNPKPGWGAAGAFNWFRADLSDPAGASDDFARVQIRPLMGGVSYNVVAGPLLTSFSIVAGPSFNSATFEDRFVRSGVAAIDADASFAVRPGIGLTYTLAPRVALVGFGGYLINRPEIVYRDNAGVEWRDQWRADSIVLSIGGVYSIF